jgi:hypothetical protein
VQRRGRSLGDRGPLLRGLEEFQHNAAEGQGCGKSLLVLKAFLKGHGTIGGLIQSVVHDGSFAISPAQDFEPDEQTAAQRAEFIEEASGSPAA